MFHMVDDIDCSLLIVYYDNQKVCKMFALILDIFTICNLLVIFSYLNKYTKFSISIQKLNQPRASS